MSSTSANSSRKRTATGDTTQTTLSWAKRPKRTSPSNETTANPQPQTRSTPTKQNKTPSATPSTPHRPTANATSPSSSNKTLTVTESTGDIFAAPNNTLLIHACNCQASWSAGIAKAFKDNYPRAYTKYAAHCRKWDAEQLFGTAVLIAPDTGVFAGSRKGGVEGWKGRVGEEQNEGVGGEGANDHDADVGGDGNDDDDAEQGDPRTHFVGCLFTSHHYGRRKDSPARILAATKPAMEDLLGKVQAYNESVEEGRRIGEVRMCKINSGLFNVPWHKTKGILEGIEVEGMGVGEVKVVSREE